MRKRGFTLVELLVVVSIALLLMAMVSAAAAAARGGQRKQATAALIAKLNAIVMQQYSTYASRSVSVALLSGTSKSAARAAYLRRMASGDLPDRWTDVAFMAGTAGYPQTPHQQAYVGIWNGASPKPSDTFAGAECLFMIVMQGGVADCLDCSDLKTATMRDKDNDGRPEFWDDWGNPIGFILWPAGLKLPAGTPTNFFLSTPPYIGGSTGRIMRPLIYSAGPDGEYGFERNGEAGNLAAGAACGEPTVAPTSASANPLAGCEDNITNFDAEAVR